MAYTAKTWATNDTIDEDSLNNIEQGIADLDDAVSTLEETVASLDTSGGSVTVAPALTSGTLIATINGTAIYAPSYTDADDVSY